MAQLNTKIKLYAKANGVNSIDFLTDVKLEQSGGQDVIIKEWNLSIDEPTSEQIASYETAGNTAETLNDVLATRQNSYKPLNDQLDQLYHDMIAGKLDQTGEWFKSVKAVKDSNPK